MTTKILLTDMTIKNLPTPQTGITQYSDTKLPGFGLRVTSQGLKTFTYRYRFNGALRRMSLGHYPETKLSDARTKADNARINLKNRIDPEPAKSNGPAPLDVRQPTSPSKSASGSGLTVSTAIDLYVEQHCNKYNRAKTRHEKIRSLRRDFEPHVKDRNVKTITKAEISTIVHDIAQRAPSAANHALDYIKALFGWLEAKNHIDTSPCAAIKNPAPTNERERILTPSEIKMVWAAAAHCGYPYGTLTQLALLTAQRRTEISAMQWSEIDFKQAIWTLPQERTKNGHLHIVPLSPQVIAILRQLHQFDSPLRKQYQNFIETKPRGITSNAVFGPSDYVFPSLYDLSKPINGLSKGKRRIALRSKVKGWCIHDLRRTTATTLGMLDVNPEIVPYILNHHDSGVTGIYNLYKYLPQRREAMNKWATYLDDLCSDEIQNLAA